MEEMISPEWSLAPEVWGYREGVLYWRVKCGRGVSVKHIGDKVRVKPDSLGYQYVTYRRKHYAVHRVVFLLTQGWLPDCVDHIDCDPGNNIAANLRAATRLQNQHNRRPNKKSKSGVKNVYMHQGRWHVRFSVQRKTIHYGGFDTIEQAAHAARAVRDTLHKEFARHA